MRPYFEASAEKRSEILDVITSTLTGRQEILVAFLFGSFFNEARFHDVDLGIVVDAELVPAPAAFDFASDLATNLELQLRIPIDLNVLNDASIALQYQATRGEVLFSRDDEVLTRFLEEAWREYLDFEPFLRQSLKDLLHE